MGGVQFWGLPTPVEDDQLCPVVSFDTPFIENRGANLNDVSQKKLQKLRIAEELLRLCRL